MKEGFQIYLLEKLMVYYYNYKLIKGGYAYCGLAALVCLNEVNKIDIGRFIHWLNRR